MSTAVSRLNWNVMQTVYLSKIWLQGYPSMTTKSGRCQPYFCLANILQKAWVAALPRSMECVLASCREKQHSPSPTHPAFHSLAIILIWAKSETGQTWCQPGPFCQAACLAQGISQQQQLGNARHWFCLWKFLLPPVAAVTLCFQLNFDHQSLNSAHMCLVCLCLKCRDKHVKVVWRILCSILGIASCEDRK